MRMYDIIKKKRDGGELSMEELRQFVNSYTLGKIPDYQASALLMAIFFQGMTRQETFNLTTAMVNSGERVDLSNINGPTVDKHSTGGVGDKTSLIVAPLAAALGCKVAKMSGRGLGHTGGTIDKLESIPGFVTELSDTLFFKQVNEIGLAIIGSTGNLAPADKRIYALRDVTATVDSIPLIATSIMSKKLAAGSQNIVLDVKVGSGAFMKDLDSARELAQLMVDIGNSAGRNVTAVLSNMDVPLGYNIGNNLEVKEAIEVLQGHGPEDLKELCLTLASLMYASGFQKPLEVARVEAEEALSSGAALQKFRDMVHHQRGNVRIADHPEELEEGKIFHHVRAPKAGYISAMDTEKIGVAATLLGAGRETKNGHIDFTAGIVLHKKTGDYVKEGLSICTMHTNNEKSLYEAEQTLLSALTITETPPTPEPLIFEIIQ